MKNITRDNQIEMLRIVNHKFDSLASEVEKLEQTYSFDNDIYQSLICFMGAVDNAQHDACIDSFKTLQERATEEQEDQLSFIEEKAHLKELKLHYNECIRLDNPRI